MWISKQMEAVDIRHSNTSQTQNSERKTLKYCSWEIKQRGNKLRKADHASSTFLGTGSKKPPLALCVFNTVSVIAFNAPA